MTEDDNTDTDGYAAVPISSRVTLIRESQVHPLLQSNMWHIQGEQQDLLIDTGLGTRPLRPALGHLLSPSCILVMTHGHLDHSGSAPEFVHRWGHRDEPFADSRAATLHTASLESAFKMQAGELGIEDTWLVPADPARGFDPREYTLPAATPTRLLSDGDVIELGNVTLQVIHLPGHTPGSIALWWESEGTLFTGDVLYDDDALLATLPESHPGDYARSLRRLRRIPAHTYYPGHDAPFGRERCEALLDRFIPQLDTLART